MRSTSVRQCEQIVLFIDHDSISFCFSIIRAFLIEEQRIVAMVMKSKKGPGATETPAAVAPTTSQKSK